MSRNHFEKDWTDRVLPICLTILGLAGAIVGIIILALLLA